MPKKKKVPKKKTEKVKKTTTSKPAARKKNAKKPSKGAKSRKVSAKTNTPKRAKKAVKTRHKRTQKRAAKPSEPSSTPETFGINRTRSRRGQSGDLEGLSTLQGADSESVEELMEEGNAFEAGTIAGVERAGDSTREVRTSQVPEDDVPEEYLDQD